MHNDKRHKSLNEFDISRLIQTNIETGVRKLQLRPEGAENKSNLRERKHTSRNSPNLTDCWLVTPPNSLLLTTFAFKANCTRANLNSNFCNCQNLLYFGNTEACRNISKINKCFYLIILVTKAGEVSVAKLSFYVTAPWVEHGFKTKNLEDT